MIKQIGSVGFFLRYESGASGTYRLFSIYDSYEKNNLILSSSINFTNNVISASGGSSSFTYYVDGTQSSSVSARYWQNVLVSFSPKIFIDASKDFIVEFGDTTSSTNIYIQNVYINNNSIQNEYEAKTINSAFNGSHLFASNVVSASVRHSLFIDFPEKNYTASARNVVYQPRFGQKRFLTDIKAAGRGTCISYLSAANAGSLVLIGDQFYVDNVQVVAGDNILSLYDGNIYTVGSDNKFSILSSQIGDVVYVLNGLRNKNEYFIKTTSSTWENTQMSVKYNFDQSEEEGLTF
jgi:hypothetical protein